MSDIARGDSRHYGSQSSSLNPLKLAGGSIRNIVVNAAYLAASDGGQVTMVHLFHGTRRELQKMGRLTGDDDLQLC